MGNTPRLAATAATVLTCFLVAAPAELRADQGGISWDFGVKAGYLFDGEVYLAEFDHAFDTDPGFMLTATADALLSERLCGGAYALVAFSGAYDESATIYDLGLSLKARFPAGITEIRVGPVLAYQVVSVESGSFDDSTGLNVGAVFDLLYPVSDTLDGIFELGFISQPAGGNDDTDATFAPIIYLAAGLGFGG